MTLQYLQSKTWNKAFEKYLKDLQFPYSIEDREEVLDWILGHAVRMEYGDGGKYMQLQL